MHDVLSTFLSNYKFHAPSQNLSFVIVINREPNKVLHRPRPQCCYITFYRMVVVIKLQIFLNSLYHTSYRDPKSSDISRVSLPYQLMRFRICHFLINVPRKLKTISWFRVSFLPCCEIWISQSSVHEDSSLQGYYAVLTGRSLLTFRFTVVTEKKLFAILHGVISQMLWVFIPSS